MIQRCTNPRDKSYPRYGGRGITICGRWRTFLNFLADLGPRPSPNHSLERIDNNRGYSPENCVWATPREQANNFRRNHRLTWNGRTQTLVQWSRELGLNQHTIINRLRRGWTIERALTTPLC